MQLSKVSGTKKDHTVTIYALSTCVWCKMTKQFLSDNGVEYQFIDVETLIQDFLGDVKRARRCEL